MKIIHKEFDRLMLTKVLSLLAEHSLLLSRVSCYVRVPFWNRNHCVLYQRQPEGRRNTRACDR
jgi:hypothetical protein